MYEKIILGVNKVLLVCTVLDLVKLEFVGFFCDSTAPVEVNHVCSQKLFGC